MLRVINRSILGGPWVVIIWALSPRVWVITTVTLLITLLTTTHERPSTSQPHPPSRATPASWLKLPSAPIKARGLFPWCFRGLGFRAWGLGLRV